MTRSRALLCLAAALLATTAGCAKDSGSADKGTSPYAADDVVVRIEYTGGFLAPGALAARVPILTVYGDGRVFTEGPVPAIFPGPALPNIQVRQISPGQVIQVVSMARNAGVGVAKDLGHPPVADVPTTRFSVRTDTGLEHTDVEALQHDNGGGLSDEQKAARTKLKDLAAALEDLDGTLGTDKISTSAPYAPNALAALSDDYVAGDQTPAQKEVAWPGPALPGEPYNGNTVLHCVVADGRAGAAVLDAATKANAMTPWTYGGKAYHITFRPLLPDEQSCGSINASAR